MSDSPLQIPADRPFRLLIGGELVSAGSGAELAVHNPADESEVARVPSADAAEVDAVLAAAAGAAPAWGRLPAVEREKHLVRLADAVLAHREPLARLLTAETGKLLSLARGEVEAAADFLVFHARHARRIKGDILPSDAPDEEIRIHRVPYGVTLGIVAWNFPLALACRKLGPALTAGNTMILKPPPLTPLAVLELGRLALEAGLPPGVVGTIAGEDAVIGDALVTDPRTKLVTMTGSTRIGQRIARLCAERMTAVRLELGGKAPFIVMEDADIDKAVDAAMIARYTNGGQVCTCSERYFLHEDIHDRFVEAFVARSAALRLGDPFHPDTELGPKLSARELERVDDLVQAAVADGATVATGGKRPAGAAFAKGHWYEPTVLLGATPSMRVMREEVFGPVSPVMKISSWEQAVELANDSDYGLSAFVFTEDFRRLARAVHELEYGELYLNRTMGEQRQGFHSGLKLSGTGGEDGEYGLDGYSEKKTVYLNHAR